MFFLHTFLTTCKTTPLHDDCNKCYNTCVANGASESAEVLISGITSIDEVIQKCSYLGSFEDIISVFSLTCFL